MTRHLGRSNCNHKRHLHKLSTTNNDDQPSVVVLLGDDFHQLDNIFTKFHDISKKGCMKWQIRQKIICQNFRAATQIFRQGKKEHAILCFAHWAAWSNDESALHGRVAAVWKWQRRLVDWIVQNVFHSWFCSEINSTYHFCGNHNMEILAIRFCVKFRMMKTLFYPTIDSKCP